MSLEFWRASSMARLSVSETGAPKDDWAGCGGASWACVRTTVSDAVAISSAAAMSDRNIAGKMLFASRCVAPSKPAPPRGVELGVVMFTSFALARSILFVAQGFDGLHFCGLVRGQVAEEQTGRTGNHERRDDAQSRNHNAESA